MMEYREAFKDGYDHAREELLENLCKIEGLDDYTIDRICEMIENNQL
jgi:hypothetical protein